MAGQVAGDERGSRAVAVALAVSAGAAGALAVAWALAPDAFSSWFAVDYGYARARINYNRNLRDFPKLLACLTAALAALSFAALRFRSGVGRALSSVATVPGRGDWWLLSGLFAAGLAWSRRSWVFWNRPAWDGYADFGETIHRALSTGDFGALREFAVGYLHAPSPLTPALVGLLRFAVPDPVVCLQLISALATGVCLLLVMRLSRRLAPSLPPWFVGALLLTHPAVARDSFFPLLDAPSAGVAMLFLWRWDAWLRDRSARNLEILTVCSVLALFQKTTLLPLLAVPVIVELHTQWRGGRWRLRDLVTLSLACAILPLTLFGACLFGLGLDDNFARQVEVMGTGWNVADHSLQRFAFATAFLMGPLLPFALWRLRDAEGLRLGAFAFSLLFVAGIAVTGGPFWSRYYSHIAGPWLIAAAPALAHLATRPGSLAVGVTYLCASAGVAYAMLFWEIF